MLFGNICLGPFLKTHKSPSCVPLCASRLFENCKFSLAFKVAPIEKLCSYSQSYGKDPIYSQRTSKSVVGVAVVVGTVTLVDKDQDQGSELAYFSSFV